MEGKENRKSYIDYLKAFAGVLVVLGHELSYYQDHYGSFSFFGRGVESLIYAVHVPLFFAVAGYLCHEQPVLPFYKKKVIRIFIPFVTFSILKLIYRMIMPGAGVAETGGLISGSDSVDGFASAGRLADIGRQLKEMFLYGNQYWFCYAILLCYLVAPLFFKKAGFIAASILFGLCLVLPIVWASMGLAMEHGVFQIIETVYFYPFFYLGYVWQLISEKNISVKPAPAIVISLICIVLFLYVDLNSMGTIFYRVPIRLLASLGLIVISYCISRLLPDGIRGLSYLGSISLQMMLFDSFFKVLLFKFLGVLLVLSPAFCILTTVINVFMTVICCMIISRIPRVKVLFGL